MERSEIDAILAAVAFIADGKAAPEAGPVLGQRTDLGRTRLPGMGEGSGDRMCRPVSLGELVAGLVDRCNVKASVLGTEPQVAGRAMREGHAQAPTTTAPIASHAQASRQNTAIRARATDA